MDSLADARDADDLESTGGADYLDGEEEGHVEVGVVVTEKQSRKDEATGDVELIMPEDGDEQRPVSNSAARRVAQLVWRWRMKTRLGLETTMSHI